MAEDAYQLSGVEGQNDGFVTVSRAIESLRVRHELRVSDQSLANWTKLGFVEHEHWKRVDGKRVYHVERVAVWMKANKKLNVSGLGTHGGGGRGAGRKRRTHSPEDGSRRSEQSSGAPSHVDGDDPRPVPPLSSIGPLGEVAEREKAERLLNGPMDNATAVARLNAAKARTAELELAEKQGRMIDSARMVEAVDELLSSLRSQIEGAADRVGPRLAAAAGLSTGQRDALVIALDLEMRKLCEQLASNPLGGVGVVVAVEAAA